MRAEVSVAHTTPVPAVAPLADRLSVPPGWVGVSDVNCDTAVVLMVLALNRYARRLFFSGQRYSVGPDGPAQYTGPPWLCPPTETCCRIALRADWNLPRFAG